MQTYNQRHPRKGPDYRSLLDYFMAALMAFFGVFVMFSEKFLGYDYFADSMIKSTGAKVGVGIAFILFGAFRAYQGYIRKRYANQDDED